MKRDEIRIDNLEIYAYHGVFAEENEKGQPFFVNAVLYTDTRAAGLADELTLSTHYGEVCHFITKWMQEHTCKLIETVAEGVAQAVLLEYPLVEAIDLEIRKPEAPIGLPFDSVSVRIHRGWHKAYLSVGSNLGDREGQIARAITALEQEETVRVEMVSEFFNTKPYGGVKQQDFLNGAVALSTLLPPEELLQLLHKIEAAAHREREVRWGPRTLDLDIVFYDKLVYESEDLIIPHVDMENRYFVLKPLSQLIPNYRHPLLGKTVTQLLEAVAASE